ncbi:MAG: phosphate/phosphite/phosphonate ABC transporter substrate-binding protein [Desulfobacteraceae bacterium]
MDFSNRVAIEKPGRSKPNKRYFRVAVAAMISAQETVGSYHELLDYIAQHLGREIKLIQRKTYHEINELIGLGQIDLAFICSGPYAYGRKRYRFEALAMPEVSGAPFYQAYLIVNRKSEYQSLADLRGKVFAFTDPESNTGQLVPAYWLGQKHERPEDYFSKIIYTHSHDNSILAVAMSLVDGAAVNSQIWEYYHQRNPMHTANTRVIRKSQSFGTPPVVVPVNMPKPLKDRIRLMLLNMHHDPRGREILDGMLIDRFTSPVEERYTPILGMMKNR